MNCGTCKANKIGPKIAPFGGFLCSNEHLQCTVCDEKAEGQCAICEQGTSFVQMNFNNKPSAASTSYPLDSVHNITNTSDVNTSYNYSKTFFEDIETQSSISQEQLSMHDSLESIPDAKKTLTPQQIEQPKFDNANKVQGFQAVVTLSDNMQIENVFIANTPQETADSHLDFQRESESCSLKKSVECTDRNFNKKVEPDHVEKTEGQHKISSKSVNSDKKIEDLNAICNTSDIRFIDSSESLRNYYDEDRMNSSATKTVKPTEQSEQQFGKPESLSVKTLLDFECDNTVNSSELVESYLRNYGPLGQCYFPGYTFNQYGVCGQWSNEIRPITQVRSVSISTESEPCLPAHSQAKTSHLATKSLSPNYIIMQATGIPKALPGALRISDKMARPSIDIRMQKVLETFQEEPRQPKIIEKPLLEQTTNFTKMPNKELQSPCTITPEKLRSTNVSEKTAGIENTTLVSNTYRAFYNPPAGPFCQSHSPMNEPKPQFQLITSPLLISDVPQANDRYGNAKVLPACQMQIPRAPITCPDTACKRIVFVSDFNKHLIVDHSILPTERIAPRQCKNFFIDPRLTHHGIKKCNMLYLIRDKITDLGSSKFKDFLPLLVMSTRVKLSTLCDAPKKVENKSFHKKDIEFLMIWLTGIVAEEYPVAVSLTVWSRSGGAPSCQFVHSGEMYSIRKSQEVLDVYRSGQMLLLSPQELHELTNDCKDMLELQIVIR